MKWFGIVLLIFPLVVAGADAEDDAEARLATLEKRIGELEGRREEKPSDWLRRVRLDGFFDTTYRLADRGRDHPDGRRGSSFSVGELDLTFTGKLDERFSFLTETAIETDDANNVEIDLERAFLRYHYSDEWNVEVGRFHTPLGYWDTAYHHGRILHATIDRPDFLAFEDDDGLLPTHSVGLQFAGRLSAPATAFLYNASVFNGRGRMSHEVQGAGDANADPAYLLNLAVEPEAVPGLRVGGSTYLDRIPPDPTTAGRTRIVDEKIFGGYAVYRKGPWEVLSEFFGMEHKDRYQEYRHDLYYLQGAYRIGRFKPYYRHERADGPKGAADPFFGAIPTTYVGDLVGVGWDLSRDVVLKLELRRKGAAGSAVDEDSVAVQVAFHF